MLGRPRESVQVAATGIALARKHGTEHGGDIILVVNLIEALTDIGEWEEADRVGAAAIRAGGSQWPSQRLVARAAWTSAAVTMNGRARDLQAALATVQTTSAAGPPSTSPASSSPVDDGGGDDAEDAVGEGLRRLQSGGASAARLCARACAPGELAALARAPATTMRSRPAPAGAAAPEHRALRRRSRRRP